MKPVLIIRYCLVFWICAAFVVPGGSALAEQEEQKQAKVVFECGDIGVEARRVLSRLKKERKHFASRQKELEQRENELKKMEKTVDKKLERLKALRSDLEELFAEKNETEQKRVKKLSKIYQKREPAGAAASLAEMEQDMAVAVLAGMRDKYAGEILDNMENKTAVRYSTALARMEP
ncbi:MAG: hypothetical protein R6X08_06520 [Desulfosalsimonadaceae bacterium]